ncbi:MAG: hypothetical protein JW991_00775 [Candidatus Pacebacteria bacterium]|nr:hypothetical protein [Candidatus Paceibacterota bacterium]
MNSERAKFIHLDGMDLAGKSLIANSFASRQSAPWIVQRKSICQEENIIRLLADSIGRSDSFSPEILGNLYAVALMADLEMFTWPEVNTIQDSTIILRSLAFHTVSGTPRIPEVLVDMLPQHPLFDHSFILTASLEARLQRLEQRRKDRTDLVTERDLMIVAAPERFMAMEAVIVEIGRKHFHSETIDTTRLTPELVVSQIERYVLK